MIVTKEAPMARQPKARVSLSREELVALCDLLDGVCEQDIDIGDPFQTSFWLPLRDRLEGARDRSAPVGDVG
jgi:hypothetical protein